jgi:hypothetical protein
MQAVKRISAKWKNGTSQNISTKLHTHGWFGKSSTLRLKDLHIGVLVEELCGASLPGFLGGSGVSRDHDDRTIVNLTSQRPPGANKCPFLLPTTQHLDKESR